MTNTQHVARSMIRRFLRNHATPEILHLLAESIQDAEQTEYLDIINQVNEELTGVTLIAE